MKFARQLAIDLGLMVLLFAAFGHSVSIWRAALVGGVVYLIKRFYSPLSEVK